MANRIPIVLDTGELAQLGSSDALVDQSGTTFLKGTVSADDNAVLRANGTSEDLIQGSTARINDSGQLVLDCDAALEVSGSRGAYIAILDSADAIVFQVTAIPRSNGSLGLGQGALDAVTSGVQNVALGQNAATTLNTGNNNVSIGNSAAGALEGGSSNISIGTMANGAAVSTSNNIAIGVNANGSNLTGSSNVFIGTSAGLDSTSTVQSVGIGNSALQNQTTGASNTAVGHAAASGAGSFTAVTAVGTNTLVSATGGSNTAIGHSAGRSMTTGFNNTFLGRNAGFDASNQVPTVQNSTALGYDTYTTANNQVVIGNEDTEETNLRGRLRQVNSPDCVSGLLSYFTETDDATFSTLVEEGSGDTGYALTAGTSVVVDGVIAAIRDDGSEGAAYHVRAAARRPTVGSGVLMGTPAVTVIHEDDAALDVTIDVSAGVLLRFLVQGVTSETWLWSASLRFTEVRV